MSVYNVRVSQYYTPVQFAITSSAPLVLRPASLSLLDFLGLLDLDRDVLLRLRDRLLDELRDRE